MQYQCWTGNNALLTVRQSIIMINYTRHYNYVEAETNQLCFIKIIFYRVIIRFRPGISVWGSGLDLILLMQQRASFLPNRTIFDNVDLEVFQSTSKLVHDACNYKMYGIFSRNYFIIKFIILVSMNIARNETGSCMKETPIFCNCMKITRVSTFSAFFIFVIQY